MTFNQGVTGSRPVRPTKQNYSTPRNSNIFRVVRYTLEIDIYSINRSGGIDWAVEKGVQPRLHTQRTPLSFSFKIAIGRAK